MYYLCRNKLYGNKVWRGEMEEHFMLLYVIWHHLNVD